MDGKTATQRETPPAVSLRLTTLKNRPDFQRATRSPRVAMPGFILQMRKRHEGEAEGIRVGFTCSKKVGNTVPKGACAKSHVWRCHVRALTAWIMFWSDVREPRQPCLSPRCRMIFPKHSESCTAS